MSWLLITILAYFFLALVSLFDRYFLVGPMPDPKIYTFYIGALWIFTCFLLIPFEIILPKPTIIILGLITGVLRIFAVLFLAYSILRSEISRVMPIIGGLLPIFSLIFFSFYFQGAETLNLSQITAFFLIIFGSVLISLKNFSIKFFTFESLKYPVSTAFLFALSFFLTKNLFLKTDFLSGFFLILLGGGLGAMSFLIFSQFRKNVFTRKLNQKMSGIFFIGQIFGSVGVILQQYAIFLARPNQVPVINALEGIRYVFLLLFIFILSFWKPNLLKEEMKGAVLLQKLVAILLIGLGLTILSLK